ncbi:MAG: hypothetical protein H0X38_00975 [Planctomycetes bacterium]|nr:hypothetical protein [Planctomycetota bacterium]
MISRARHILGQAGALPSLRWKPVGTGKRSLVDWTPQHDAFLGLATDATLAELWDVPTSSVYYRRRRLALPARVDTGLPTTWTTAMLRDLERLTNRQIAAKYRIGGVTVAHKRRERKVAPATRWNTVQWTAAMLRALGTRPDNDIATTYDLQPATVRAKRKALGIAKVIRTKVDWLSAAVIRQLGTIPDDVLAERLGVNQETVRIRRTAAGRAPYRAFAWTPDIIARLGTVPDRVIAEEIGATTSTVAWQRNQRGITTWDTRAKKTPDQ